LQWERELLGIYLSSHPLEPFEALLAEQSVAISHIKPAHDGRNVSIGGAIQDVREITTKTGQKMAFVKVGDQTAELELILFPSIYQQTIGIWERDRIVLAKGKVSTKDREGVAGQEIKILIDDAREVTHEQAAAYQATGKKKSPPKPAKPKPKITKSAVTEAVEAQVAKRVYIRLEHSEDQDMLLSLKTTIDSRKGDTEVVLVLGMQENKQIIKLPMRVMSDDETLGSIGELVGADNVKLH
jgi:DNA polymerase III alpha subunit